MKTETDILRSGYNVSRSGYGICRREVSLPGKEMSTINDVSRLAGVSKATVSRVLSGSRGVKEASRQAVLKAVDELNYRPNVIAQSLLSQSTGCISDLRAGKH